MSFEENRGQAEARFNYLARTRLHALLLSSAGAVIAGDGGRAELRFVGGSPAARSFAPEGPSGRVSYFAGNNQRRWIRGVPAYAKVRYQNVYPGIDVVWYGREGRLEFDVIVAPGTDPGAAVLEVRGRAASIDPAGALVLQPAHDHIELRPPIAYQEKDGERRPVHAAWAKAGSDSGSQATMPGDHS